MCQGLLWEGMPSRSWAGGRKMEFPTGFVPTPGTLTGVIMVSRSLFQYFCPSVIQLDLFFFCLRTVCINHKNEMIGAPDLAEC